MINLPGKQRLWDQMTPLTRVVCFILTLTSQLNTHSSLQSVHSQPEYITVTSIQTEVYASTSSSKTNGLLSLRFPKSYYLSLLYLSKLILMILSCLESLGCINPTGINMTLMLDSKPVNMQCDPLVSICHAKLRQIVFDLLVRIFGRMD